MKQLVFFLFSVLFLNVAAQDTLAFKNGAKIISLVLLVGEDSIRYKPIKNIMGPDLYAKNEEVAFIKYKNGSFENIDSLYKSNKIKKNIKSVADKSYNLNGPERMHELGKEHASLYYKCKGCALGFGVAGLIVGPLAVYLQ